MKIIDKIKIYFYISVFFMFLMSVSILFMPSAVEQEVQKGLYLMLIGSTFWISLIIGYVFVILANIKRKKFIMDEYDGNLSMNCHIGIITFFDNLPSSVADVTMIFSFILFIIIDFTSIRYSFVAYVLLAVLVFSLNMHCMLNGRIYKIMKFRGNQTLMNKEM